MHNDFFGNSDRQFKRTAKTLIGVWAVAAVFAVAVSVAAIYLVIRYGLPWVVHVIKSTP